MSLIPLIRREGCVILMMIGLVSLALAETPTTSPSTKPATTQSAKPKRGEILELTKETITAMPMTAPRVNERGGPKTYKVDDNTRVYISVLTEERINDKGQVTRSYRMDPATLDDLQVGLLARIDPDADGEHAMRITIVPDMPEPPKKKKPN